MKRLLINLVAVMIIGIGGLSLTNPATVKAQAKINQAKINQAKIELKCTDTACCTTDGEGHIIDCQKL